MGINARGVYGLPGLSIIGIGENDGVWSVLQHLRMFFPCKHGFYYAKTQKMLESINYCIW